MASKKRGSFVRAPGEDLVEYEQQIESVKYNMNRRGSTREETQNEINKLKQSFSSHRTATSLNTIFALTNSMVGSVCLLIPITFAQTGIIMSILIMFLIGLINMKTSQLYLAHLREGEVDLSDLIMRTLGKKYAILFNFSSSLLMFLVGTIYFILINNTAYPMLCFILTKANANPDSYVSQDHMNDEMVFSKFSIQWLSVIIIVCVFPLFLIKNMKFIMKLAHGGFFAIGMYVIFILYAFIDNAANGNLAEHASDVKFFTGDIAAVGGNFALAFMVHNAIAQIMSQNARPEKNNRDMSIGYLLAATIYAIIGIFGTYGIVGRSHPDNASTITQYFDSDSVPPFIINLFFSGHLITAYPLFCYISKTQFFNLIMPTSVPSPLAVMVYNFFFGGCCFLMVLLNISPGIVIGITGAVVGFAIVYLLPILIHMKCIIKNSQANKNSQNEQLLINNDYSTTSSVNTFSCGNHNITERNIYVRGAFYLTIVGIGIYLAIIQLIPIFQSF
ncbi:transmembrane amino acid transporter protein (macronuclear) [Tetrahymena thermophila SB210]|uniref:Transmembrane amino acid transporter protein n=1 Tax=Tetrahymena thermophila (strain SB210) TaxID=312017 RepID=I7LWN4_TETTS|nr:transmembrane amino acid transporter protein [Tetrahymena thermophila SB210]EAS02413.2 transmembrane amino acid transporter protein [Tetrahymena thermophila SB210]|eukprot:XP_001022658.2 transmembrane amino acid transporter protein [Tetrahymena thermophila SB210]